MLPCLRRVLRPALSLRAGTGLATAGLGNHQIASPTRCVPLSVLLQRCNLGTHPLKEPVEPLNSPRGAKEFIYSLHPTERTCLLRELHRFESIAIAQGRWCGIQQENPWKYSHLFKALEKWIHSNIQHVYIMYYIIIYWHNLWSCLFASYISQIAIDISYGSRLQDGLTGCNEM